jgi:hypothetical protein
MTHDISVRHFTSYVLPSSLFFQVPSPTTMFRTAIRRFPAPTRVLANANGIPKPGRPSPAERPSDVPDSISFEHKPVPAEVVDKFEPIVNDMSKTLAEEPVDAPPAAPAAAPLEPPTPAPAPEAASEAIPDKPDLSSLPSLDIDPSLPVSIAEPTASSSGSDGPNRERTGARAKHSLSSIDRRWRTLRRLALAGSLVGGGVGAWYLANKDEPGMNDAGSAWERFKNNAAELTDVSTLCAFVHASADGFEDSTSTNQHSTSFSPIPFPRLISDHTPSS